MDWLLVIPPFTWISSRRCHTEYSVPKVSQFSIENCIPKQKIYFTLFQVYDVCEPRHGMDFKQLSNIN